MDQVQELIDVRKVLREDSSLESGNLQPIQEIIAGSQVSDLRNEVAALQTEIESQENAPENLIIRVGICHYLLGNHPAADRVLSNVGSHRVASYYHAKVLSSQSDHSGAEKKFEEAASAGADSIDCTLQRAGEIRSLGNLEEAENLLRSIAKDAAGRAEYCYQMGCIFSDRADTYAAIEYFERAVDMDAYHSSALFRLAAENALRGNDDEAIKLYEQSLSKPPFYLGAMMNLGLLYEDQENYAAAAFCFRRVIDIQPAHVRANLYLKDIDATNDMYYDEESARNEARLRQLLNRPVTDFELSVRSRNCLQAMNIMVLGDLTRISEQELLAGKNFGETSLVEIREVMSTHGLFIGQNLHQGKSAEQFLNQTNLTPQEQAAVSMPISDLNLSVRARKCMNRLGLTTVGELISRTADELLSSRNFGVTSLNEVRAKLHDAQLKLRND